MMNVVDISQPPRSILTYIMGSGGLRGDRPFNVGTRTQVGHGFPSPRMANIEGRDRRKHLRRETERM